MKIDVRHGSYFDDVLGINARWSRGIHVRDNRCCSHRAIEKPEQRKAGQVDSARLDVEPFAYLINLSVKISVGVEHTLGRARAAGCENPVEFKNKARAIVPNTFIKYVIFILFPFLF